MRKKEKNSKYIQSFTSIFCSQHTTPYQTGRWFEQVPYQYSNKNSTYFWIYLLLYIAIYAPMYSYVKLKSCFDTSRCISFDSGWNRYVFLFVLNVCIVSAMVHHFSSNADPMLPILFFHVYIQVLACFSSLSRSLEKLHIFLSKQRWKPLRNKVVLCETSANFNSLLL